MFQSSLSRRRLITLAGAGVLGAAVGSGLRMPQAHAALADQYELIDLGVTSPTEEINLGFNDMNASGVMVGNMYIDAEKNSPWVFQDGKLTRIKTGKYGARVSCINDSGVMGGRDILGWHNEEQAFGQPVFWIDGEKEVLPYPDGLPSPAEEGRVFDINNSGDAVGSVSIAGGSTFPVIWRNGVPELLEMPSENSRGGANFINQQGTVLGDVSLDDGAGGGATWSAFGFSLFTFTSPAGYESANLFYFSGLDDNDRALGAIEFGGIYVAAHAPALGGEAVVFPMQDPAEELAQLACSAGANLFGGAVATGGKPQAAIWNNGERTEFKSLVKNTKGLRLKGIWRMTESGVVAGQAVDGDGAVHPFQAVPI